MDALWGFPLLRLPDWGLEAPTRVQPNTAARRGSAHTVPPTPPRLGVGPGSGAFAFQGAQRARPVFQRGSCIADALRTSNSGAFGLEARTDCQGTQPFVSVRRGSALGRRWPRSSTHQCTVQKTGLRRAQSAPTLTSCRWAGRCGAALPLSGKFAAANSVITPSKARP